MKGTAFLLAVRWFRVAAPQEIQTEKITKGRMKLPFCVNISMWRDKASRFLNLGSWRMCSPSLSYNLHPLKSGSSTQWLEGYVVLHTLVAQCLFLNESRQQTQGGPLRGSIGWFSLPVISPQIFISLCYGSSPLASHLVRHRVNLFCL